MTAASRFISIAQSRRECLLSQSAAFLKLPKLWRPSAWGLQNQCAIANKDERLSFWHLLLVFVAGLAMFLPRISTPSQFVFDEVFYVPSALALVNGSAPSVTEVSHYDVSHPPLGKMIIASGIALFGNRSLGWRFMSALAGALALCAIFVWTWLLTSDRELALWAAAVSMVNNLLYVMARVGMLDIFCAVFLLWAFVAITAVLMRKCAPKTGLPLAGFLFGLSLACKWLALAPLVAMLVLVILWTILPEQRRNQLRLPGLQTPAWAVIALIAVPAMVYGAMFVALARRLHHPFSLAWLFEQQLTVVRSHVSHQGAPVQASHWYSWPFQMKPEVFFYGGDSRFILLLGNPLVLWTGLIAILFLLYRVLRPPASENLQEGRGAPPTAAKSLPRLFSAQVAALVVLVAFGSLYGEWAVAPRRTLFYHYYFPAALVLGPALAVALAQARPGKIFGLSPHVFLLLAAALEFIIFFPALSGIGAAWVERLFFG